MNMSDWNGWTGSQMYRDGLASGLIDFNGSLYHWGDQGFAKLNMTTNMTNGAYGFMLMEVVAVDCKTGVEYKE